MPETIAILPERLAQITRIDEGTHKNFSQLSAIRLVDRMCALTEKESA